MNLDLEDLRKQYGDVYEINVGNKTYIYRPLSIQEIKETEYLESETEREDYIVNLCVLYPKDVNFDRIKAGYVTELAEAIMSTSGILDLDSVLNYLNESRQFTSQDVVSILKAYVIAAMPSYNDEVLDCLTIKSLIDKVTLSEQILTLKQYVMGIESTGVKVHILPVEQNPVEEKESISKEELLRRINKNEKETTNPRMRDMSMKQRLEEMDEELLRKALGEASANDPIAAKLHGGR